MESTGLMSSKNRSCASKWGLDTNARRVDCCVAVLCLVAAALVGPLYGSPFARPFFEADDSISYPKVPKETVPFAELCIYAGLLPLLFAIAIPLIVRKHVGFDKPLRPSTDAVLSVLTLATSGGITAFATTFIKLYAGRLRPNFFALCEYPFNVTTHTYGSPHQLGDFSLCQASEHAVVHARSSFPSGHSSWSFSGLGFVALLIWFTVRSGPARLPRWLGIGCAAFPLFCASLIATSRTRDNYHHFADVVCGSILGFTITVCCFWSMYPAPVFRDVGASKKTDGARPMLQDASDPSEAKAAAV